MTSANKKKVRRIIKILLKDLLLFPFNWQSTRRFLQHVYAFDPLDDFIPSHVVTTDVFDLLPGAFNETVSLRNLRLKYGNMSYEEIYAVSLIVKHLQPNTIFEFGTFDGTTTLQMAQNSPNGARIYTLNLPSCDVKTQFQIGSSELDLNLPSVQPGRRFLDSLEAAKITQLYGDSANYDYTPYFGQMDLILVDASHEYIYVKSDTEQALKMLHPGGAILWHDYPNALGVAQYLHELALESPIYHLKNTHLAMYRSSQRKLNGGQR